MSDPIILSDGDDPNTPRPYFSKKPRTQPDPHLPPVLILIDDPTPQKQSIGPTFTSGSTPSFVAETPMSEPSVVRCSNAGPSDPQLALANNLSGISRLICLESDNDSDTDSKRNNDQENGLKGFDIGESEELEWRSRYLDYESHLGSSNPIQTREEDSSSQPLYERDDGDVLLPEVNDDPDKENFSLEQMGNATRQNQETKVDTDKKNTTRGATVKKKMTKEERTRLLEEKKRKKEQEKLQKAALKAEAAELKNLQKERNKWEKGKFALKSIVAEIDTKVVELGSIGGHLLSRFTDKGLTYRITTNPIEQSIVWTMTVPEHISQVLAKLTAYYARIRSRHCADESELAEHVAGLTCSLASCQFRKKLTRLCVCANGSIIPKDSIDKNLIKGNLWLKALLAIPKVQPRFALAIGKKYPTMKSLLRVYMDSTKSVHEKEFLLEDLVVEGLVGNDRRLGEICSKRVYRVLMAQSGSIKTDDIEDGADFFTH